MQNSEVIQRLWDFGHFRNPDYPNDVKVEDLGKLDVSDEAVKNAIKSYQEFFAEQFDAFSIVSHNRKGEADGILGPATLQLLEMPRCGCPDFDEPEFSLLETGSGSWPAGCLPEWPNNHTFTVQMIKSNMPSFLNDVIEPAWDLCQAAYADMGIVFIRQDDNPRANTRVTWERGRGWIGLAIVPSRFSCSLRIWAKFDTRYRPSALVDQWARLLAHEFGHNMGMRHTRGGIMNPSIIGGKFDKNEWRGDPAERTLRRYFGGVPVDLNPNPDPDPPIPELKAPTGLVSQLTKRDQVQLAWDNQSEAEEIEVHRDGSLLKTLPGRSNRSVDDNLDPGDYKYKVRAVRGTEKSDFSNTTTITVRPPSPPNPPIPPIVPEPRPWWKRFLDWLSEYLDRQQSK